MKKKVLFLSPLPPPYYGSAMSSEMCLNILKESDKFEVRNIKLNYSKDMKDIGRFNFDKIKGFFYVRKKIKEELKKFRPDIVYFVPATYSQGLFRDMFFAREIIKKYDKKILFHIRSRITQKHKEKLIYLWAYKKMLQGQKAIVLDESLEKDVLDFICKKDIYILPNAIENEIKDDDLKKIILKRIGRKSFNILFLSHMQKTKGWERLLEACILLKSKGILFKCKFAGTWSSDNEKKTFEEFIKKEGLFDSVEYVGPKKLKEKKKIFEWADILVYPTELDTFGRVVIEGMMYGLPIIAHGICAIQKTIEDGKTGFLLIKNSPEEIFRNIMKLQDINLRKKMGLAGRKRFLKEYELKDYKKKFIKIIDS